MTMTMHRPGRVHGVDGGDAAAARHPRHQPRHHPGLAHSRQHREVSHIPASTFIHLAKRIERAMSVVNIPSDIVLQ